MNLALAVLLATTATSTMMNHDQERTDLLAKAMVSTRAAIEALPQDPTRPVYHFLAPAQWMNDPNGPIYYKGWYHVFYQFNPYGDQWGHMHWGHARSRDLVDWEHLPIALWPSLSLKEEHVFSGSLFPDASGKPVAFYTSIGPREPEQWAAVPKSDDLVEWTKPIGKPVVSAQTHHPTQIDEWRDPFLFKEDGATYMVTGGRHEGHGIVALYRARNPLLTEWRYVGILFQHPDSNLVECPNLVKLGDRWLLLTSHDGRVDWFSGSVDVRKPSFEFGQRGVLAEGSYASQLLTDRDGHTVHLAWVPTSNHHGWNGFLTLPARLALNDEGAPIRTPIPELDKLRQKGVHVRDTEFEGTIELPHASAGNSIEIRADIAPGTASQIEIRLPAATIAYEVKTRTLAVPGRTPLLLPQGDLRLRLFIDHSVLELFAGEGAASSVVTFDLPATPVKPVLIAHGGRAKLKTLDVFPLRSARMDRTHFR